MSADDFLADAATRRQVMVQRVSRGMTSELEGLLEEMREEIAGRISEAGTDFQRARLGSLLTSVDSIIRGKAENISESLKDRIGEFTRDELDFQKRTLDQVLKDPTAEPNADQVISAVTSEPTSLVRGNSKDSMTINQMLGVLSGANSKELKNVISTGFIAGDTTSQITQRLSQKIRGRSKAQVRAVVQTSLNHAAGVARQKFAEENKDRLGGEKYLATLDISTTATCAGLDGNIYEVGVGPRPPLHYNCRSLRVAVPREDSVLSGLDGTRPAVGAKGAKQVSSKKTFDGWLKDQPIEFREEFFSKYSNGREKRILFDKGQLSAKDMIDPRGTEMSLPELKQKSPSIVETLNSDSVKEELRNPPIYTRNLGGGHSRGRTYARSNPSRNVINKRKNIIKRRLNSDSEQKIRKFLNETRDNIPASSEQRQRRLLDNWVRGSRRKVSVEMKEAARRELGFGGVPYSRQSFNFDKPRLDQTRQDIRNLYNETQEVFASKGQKTVRLYRGLKSSVTSPGSIESWTTDRKIAESFDGAAVLVQDVEVERLLTGHDMPSWENGPFGDQKEYLVLGGKYED